MHIHSTAATTDAISHPELSQHAGEQFASQVVAIGRVHLVEQPTIDDDDDDNIVSIRTTTATTRVADQSESAQGLDRARDHVEGLATRATPRRALFANHQADDVEFESIELSARLAVDGRVFEFFPAHSEVVSVSGRVHSGPHGHGLD